LNKIKGAVFSPYKKIIDTAASPVLTRHLSSV
jgi:hypothetical protein